MPKRSRQITVRLSPEEADQLRQAARAQDVSYAAVLRSALTLLRDPRPPLVGRTFCMDYRPRGEPL